MIKVGLGLTARVRIIRKHTTDSALWQLAENNKLLTTTGFERTQQATLYMDAI